MNARFYAVCLQLLVSTFIIIPASGQVTGSVFRDINNDGIQQSSNPIEPGEFGITVKAYDASNTLRGTTTTNANGDYSFSAVQAPSGLALRIEFTVKPGDQPSKRISAQRSNVQFVVAGSGCVNINFAVADKKWFSDNANPYVATTAFTNGNAVSSGSNTAGDRDNLHIFPYDLSNDGGSTRRAKNQHLGSVFGLAWQKESRTLLMAAYLKRHAGFGPHGIGAIYQTQIDKDGIPAMPSLLVDVAAIGINVGSNPRTNPLPDNPATPNTDVGVFAEVGKRGIGGIDLSRDGRDLYIVNMYEKKLHRINIGNPLKSSFSPADVTGNWVIPNPSVAGTIWHPMAVKVQNDKIYVGGVTVRETTGKHNIADTADMRGVVYEFNPATSVFTEVLHFPLSHRRGFSNNDYKYEFRNNYWSAWQNNGDISLTAPLRADLKANILIPPSASWPSALYYAQPMLCNIEFDIDGSMILGIRDRFGDQGGYANLFETGNEPGETYRTISSGEVLKAGISGTVWIIENNGSVTNNGVTTTTPGRTDNNTLLTGTFAGFIDGDTPWGGNYGPGGGYFYYNYNFSLTGVPLPFNIPPVTITAHYLKSNGGLAIYPGYNEVMATAMDPINRSYTSGIIRNFNSGANAGNMSGRSELIVETAGNPSGFGKAGALGDLELLLDAEAMEIGNLVWYDANSNGMQDAHETGIAGVTVVLRSPGADNTYNTGDDATWSVVTDANGHYYFDATNVNDTRRPSSWLGVSAVNSGILPGFEYRVELDRTQPSLAAYSYVTYQDAVVNDAIDSDGSMSGTARVQYILNPGGSAAATSEFSNDYNIDFGFSAILLPLKQIDLFVDNAVNNTIGVKWNTKEEFDVSKYQPQRSTDGITFYNIHYPVPSKGDGSYSYFVADDISEIRASGLYYRIKIINEDGKYEYSQIAHINLEEAMNFQLGPNPSESYMCVQVAAKKNCTGNMRIINMAGELVYNHNFYFTKGSNKVTINEFATYPRGVYVVQLYCDEKKFIRSVLKK